MNTPMHTQDVKLATWRTGWNGVVSMVIAVLVNRYTNVDIDLNDPASAGILAGIGIVVYRLSMYGASKSDFLSYLLFGTTKRPLLYE